MSARRFAASAAALAAAAVTALLAALFAARSPLGRRPLAATYDHHDRRRPRHDRQGRRPELEGDRRRRRGRSHPAIPLAIANARDEAQRIATAGRMTLGAVVSVAEPPPSPFFGGPIGAALRRRGDVRPGPVLRPHPHADHAARRGRASRPHRPVPQPLRLPGPERGRADGVRDVVVA
jgi:hypothetical protein